MKPRDTLPTGQEKVKAVRTMFDAIAPRYDLLNRILTFGMDTGWRRKTVADLGLPPGSLVLDLACGTGDFCNDLAAAGLRAVGFDNSAGMLSAATTAAPLVLADVLKLPVPDASADGITCGFALRNVLDLDRFFGEVARVVRPGGRITLRKLPDGRIEMRAARPTGRISDVFGSLKRKDGPSLSIEEMNKIAARGWAGKR